MKLNIGENIRELRKSNGITQEKLTEYLSVTYQTVSKWENGVSLPGIALLPVIANVFGVTIEELYDNNKSGQNGKIAAYEAEYARLCALGDNVRRVRLMRRAVAEYPNNFTFLNYLARSLYRYGEPEKNAKEIISLCERILENCTADHIRFSALQTMLVAGICFERNTDRRRKREVDTGEYIFMTYNAGKVRTEKSCIKC